MSERGTFLLNRYIAKAIDFLIVWAMALILPPAGPLAGLLYLLIADGFHGGQSAGKRIIGLRVVRKTDFEPASFKESILRNIPFAIAYVFFIIPFLGWFLLIIVGLPILLLESYLVCEAEGGTRMGDVIANTAVVGEEETLVGPVE